MKLAKIKEINPKFLSDFPYEISDSYELLNNNEKPIGYGVLGTNKYHPYNHYVKIIIKPNYRNQRYGKSFINRLKKITTQPFQYSTSASNFEKVNFLNSCGFRLARKCWEYEVARNNIQAQNILAFNTFENGSDEIMELLYNLIYEDYKTNHLSIGPLNEEIPKIEWLSVMLKYMNPKLSTYYFDVKNLLYMIVEKENQIPFVSYVGGIGNKKLKQNYFQSVLYDLKKEYGEIHFEIDNTDDNAMLLKEFIRIEEPVSYDTYLL